MIQNPLVSVIIPCYNNDNEQFLRECFDSVVHQTYSPIQMIVIDDGSTNGASTLLEKLQKEYNFILEKQINRGISGALNTGITKHARGKYIAMLGSDDYWASNKIELQVQFMESANDNVVASCTRGYYIFENDPSKPTPRLTRLLKPRELQFENLLMRNCIMVISVMIRQDIFNELGLFDENSAIEDWDMWLRITDKYEMGFVPEPLVYYRRHSNNMSNYFDKGYDSMKYIINKWKGRKGQKQSLNQIELAGINNFARYRKAKALKIAITNVQCADRRLYWRGIFKTFLPGFIYRKKQNSSA